MKQQVIIKVEKRSISIADSRKCVFERIIDLDSNIIPPYQQIVDTLRFLYGVDSFISFEVATVL